MGILFNFTKTMIKIYFYTFFLIVLLSCQTKQNAKADSNSQNIEQSNLKSKKEVKKIDLEKVDYKSYCGKTLGELLEDETLRNYDSYYYLDEPQFKLSFVTFTYKSAKKGISIYVGNLLYQKRFSSDRNWSLDLLMKEKLEFVNVVDMAGDPLFTCDCRE